MTDDQWGPWMRHAVTVLGLSPEAFWRLSLKEWRWLTRGPRTESLERAGLNTLMQQFPDGEM